MPNFELLFKDVSVECNPLSFEGEILEVGLQGSSNFRVGDIVFLKQDENKVCAPVVKKSASSLFLLIPLNQQTFLNDRRQFTRFSVSINGRMKSLNPEVKGIFPIQILDVSFNGFGVVSPVKISDQSTGYKLFIQERDFHIEAKVKLVNETETPDGFRYGATISAIEQESFDHLRKWILMEQNILTKKSWLVNFLASFFGDMPARK
jgi:PilZ domain